MSDEGKMLKDAGTDPKDPKEQKEPKELSTVSNKKPPPSAKQLQLPECFRSFEADPAFMSYYQCLNDFDRDRFRQMYEKNKKLREELQVISKATEEIIKKEKERRLKRDKFEDDEDVRKQDRVIRDQQQVIGNMRVKIEKRQKELDEAFQYPMVREREDQLRDLKRQIKELEDQREAAQRVRREQTKATGATSENKMEEERKQKLLFELNEKKRESKRLLEEKTEIDKIVEKNHTKLVNGKIQVRELEKKIDSFKNNKNKDELQKRQISKEDLEVAKAELDQLKRERKQKAKEFEDDVRDYERMKADLRRDSQKQERVLREKEKEFRLNAIKMKELKRMQRHKAVKPMRDQDELMAGEKDMDVHELLRRQDLEIEKKMLELNIDLSDDRKPSRYREAVSKEQRQIDDILGEERRIKQELEALTRQKEAMSAKQAQTEGEKEHLDGQPADTDPVEEKAPGNEVVKEEIGLDPITFPQAGDKIETVTDSNQKADDFDFDAKPATSLKPSLVKPNFKKPSVANGSPPGVTVTRPEALPPAASKPGPKKEENFFDD